MTVVKAGEAITLEETFYADKPEDAKAGARAKVEKVLTLLQSQHPALEVGFGPSDVSKLRYTILDSDQLDDMEAPFNPGGKPVWAATYTWSVRLLEPVVNG